MKKLAILILAAALFSCDSVDKKIADANDYNTYLVKSGDTSPDYTEDGVEFWSMKLNNDSSGVGAIGPLAAAYGRRFKETGQVEYLYDAQRLLEIGVEKSAHNKDAYMMSLAANFISQHRFRDAKSILEQTREIPSNKRNLELALFDIEMELGNYIEAYRLLKKNQRRGDFSHLVRMAKWADHAGKLDQAIQHLEAAKDLAFASGDKSLQVWVITNLADYYGHAGEIQKSYDYFLWALQYDPQNAYALKGIAWINYSHDSNYKEADRILDYLIETSPLPDYYLLKSEIAEADRRREDAEKWKAEFLAMAERPEYGRMYNTYIIEALAESNPEAAVERALQELEERKTAETYALFAFSMMKSGKTVNALRIVEEHVIDKTIEPSPTLYASQVLAAAGKIDESVSLAKELEDATYELGPVTALTIQELLIQF